MSRYLHYIADQDWVSGVAPSLPDELSFAYWNPTLASPLPPGMGMSGAVFSAFHFCRVFYNNQFGICQITHGNNVVHRSLVTPGYFRFPEMSKADIQIGATWTAPEWRGRGLALAAIFQILQHHRPAGANVWYITDETNTASVRVIEKAGFRLFGSGPKSPRFGLSVLGYYGTEKQDQQF